MEDKLITHEVSETTPDGDYFVDRRLVCFACNGRVFEVFRGDYLTAIKCVVCKELVPVHHG